MLNITPNSHSIDFPLDTNFSFFSMFQTPDRKSSSPSNSFESADHEKKNTITESSSHTMISLKRPFPTSSNPIPCPNADLNIEEKREEDSLAEMYNRSTWNMYNR